MDITFKITPKTVKATINEFADWYGVQLTEPQLKEILLDRPQIIRGLSNYGIDTSDREEIADFLCDKFKLGSWPVIADGQKKFDVFWKKFKAKAKRKGYRIEENNE
jgi:hypothetical protein